MEAASLEGGFLNTATDAAYAFRSIMEAVARPGAIVTLDGAAPADPLSLAAGAVLLTLCDTETPLHLAGQTNAPVVRDWVSFHTGAPIAGAQECAFALGPWDALMPLSKYPIGTPEYPDRSATLIVETEAISETGALLSGPGIKETARLPLPDVPALQANAARFPLGLNFRFTSGRNLAALPRSVRINAAVAH